MTSKTVGKVLKLGKDGLYPVVCIRHLSGCLQSCQLLAQRTRRDKQGEQASPYRNEMGDALQDRRYGNACRVGVINGTCGQIPDSCYGIDEALQLCPELSMCLAEIAEVAAFTLDYPQKVVCRAQLGALGSEIDGVFAFELVGLDGLSPVRADIVIVVHEAR